MTAQRRKEKQHKGVSTADAWRATARHLIGDNSTLWQAAESAGVTHVLSRDVIDAAVRGPEGERFRANFCLHMAFLSEPTPKRRTTPRPASRRARKPNRKGE